VSVAGQLGVSHVLLFTQSDSGNVGLRVARLPRGPTLSFRVDSFATSRQVKAAQKRPVDVAAAFHAAPLLILHNFGAAAAADAENRVPAPVALSAALLKTQAAALKRAAPAAPAEPAPATGLAGILREGLADRFGRLASARGGDDTFGAPVNPDSTFG